MDFTVEQRFGAPAERVLDLYADPEFHAALGAGDHIGPPEVVRHDRRGDEVWLDIRYRFTADLPSAARRFVEVHRLTWVEQIRIDPTSLTARSTFVADHYASLMVASARTVYSDDPRSDDGSIRRIDGRLSVKVPLVGSKVERAIVDGLRSHLDLERQMATRHLGG